MFLLYPHSPSFWLIFHQMKHWQSCLRPILPLKANGHSLEAEIWKEQGNDPSLDLEDQGRIGTILMRRAGCAGIIRQCGNTLIAGQNERVDGKGLVSAGPEAVTQTTGGR